jgi:sugar lactone lactonase YvrE
MNRTKTAVLTTLALAVLVALLPAASAKKGTSRPKTIALPAGWQPEGIASRGGRELWVGSIPDGAVWKGDARTGDGSVLVPPHAGRAAIGVKVDRRERIFVAGGPTGKAFVYSARGRDRAEYQLAATDATDTFVNDLVITRKAVWLTDSRNQQLYKLPLRKRDRLPRQAAVKTLPLTGDIQYEAGNNANGIVAARGGKVLIVVQSNTGKLFRVNPSTGATDEIELAGGADVTNGDGLLLRDRTLYVVQNRDNKVAVVKLDKGLATGSVKKELTEPEFDVPTTLARSGGRLYAVNARFGQPPTPDRTDDIVRVRGH